MKDIQKVADFNGLLDEAIKRCRQKKPRKRCSPKMLANILRSVHHTLVGDEGKHDIDSLGKLDT